MLTSADINTGGNHSHFLVAGLVIRALDFQAGYRGFESGSGRDNFQTISTPSSYSMCSGLSIKCITKTRLYNFDPLKPHFYIVKLGFTGVYIIFCISAKNIDCGYSLEPPRLGGSNEYPQSMFRAEI